MRCGGLLIVGTEADAMRRRVGPTAWAALEVLTSHAGGDAGHVVAAASVREIADALGIAKNTAHRALRKLVAAGLAHPDQKRAPDGRFVAGAYRLSVPADVLQLAPHEPLVPPPAPSRQRSRTLRSRHDVATQLDLLATCD